MDPAKRESGDHRSRVPNVIGDSAWPRPRRMRFQSRKSPEASGDVARQLDLEVAGAIAVRVSFHNGDGVGGIAEHPQLRAIPVK